jgi:dihydrodipicolinate synthase/N-acetylneuraminate lyase
MLVRCGVPANLDGIFAVFPDLAAGIVEAAERGHYALASQQQGKLTEALHMVATGKYPLVPACSAILNARGVPGKVHVAPMQTMDAKQVEQLLGEPAIQAALGKISNSVS